MSKIDSEVVRDALRLLREQDELRQDELRKEIRRGIDASTQGHVKDGEEAVAAIRRDLTQRKKVRRIKGSHFRRGLLALALGNTNDVLGWHGATFAGSLGRCDKVANSFDQFICCVSSE